MFKRKLIGPYKGKVVSVEDTFEMGKLKVTVPSVSGKAMWAMPRANLKNHWEMPNVGDPVWVDFSNGEIDFPVWSYGWVLPGQVDQSIKQSYPNNSGEGDLKVIKWKNTSIVLGQDVIEIKDEQERTIVRLSPNEDVGLTIESSANVQIKSQGNISVECEGLEIASGGNTSIITPNNLTLGAGSKIDVTATDSFFLKASKEASIHSSDAVSLKGGLTPADEHGFSADLTETKMFHHLKNSIESLTNIIKGQTLNVLDAPSNKIGGNDATQPLVLGLALSSFLSSVLQALIAHVHPTPAGPSSPSVDLGVALGIQTGKISTLTSKTNFTK